MGNRRIILINSVLFFLGWTVIFLLGADHPPPLGFLWLIPIILILDGVQNVYLRRFLPKLIKKDRYLFVKNLLFFSLGGLVISLAVFLIRFEITKRMGTADFMILVSVVTAVSLLYGILFYGFNFYLINKREKSWGRRC